MSDGWISKYQIYVSTYGRDWGEPIVVGTFDRDHLEKKILFDKSQKGRFIRFVALPDSMARYSPPWLNLT